MLIFRSFLIGLVILWASAAFAADSLVPETLESVAPSTSTIAVEPFLLPLATAKLKIVSGFGKRTIPAALLPPAGATPVVNTEVHEGVDYAVPAGTPVRASRAGRVLFAGFSKVYTSRKDKKEQSRFIIVRHGDGTSTRYVHLATLKVKPMTDVAAGDILGTVANSDEWSVPVLHFEIRTATGLAVDPATQLAPAKLP